MERVVAMTQGSVNYIMVYCPILKGDGRIWKDGAPSIEIMIKRCLCKSLLLIYLQSQFPKADFSEQRSAKLHGTVNYIKAHFVSLAWLDDP